MPAVKIYYCAGERGCEVVAGRMYVLCGEQARSKLVGLESVRQLTDFIPVHGLTRWTSSTPRQIFAHVIAKPAVESRGQCIGGRYVWMLGAREWFAQ